MVREKSPQNARLASTTIPLASLHGPERDRDIWPAVPRAERHSNLDALGSDFDARAPGWPLVPTWDLKLVRPQYASTRQHGPQLPPDEDLSIILGTHGELDPKLHRTSEHPSPDGHASH